MIYVLGGFLNARQILTEGRRKVLKDRISSSAFELLLRGKSLIKSLVHGTQISEGKILYSESVVCQAF